LLPGVVCGWPTALRWARLRPPRTVIPWVYTDLSAPACLPLAASSVSRRNPLATGFPRYSPPVVVIRARDGRCSDPPASSLDTKPLFHSLFLDDATRPQAELCGREILSHSAPIAPSACGGRPGPRGPVLAVPLLRNPKKRKPPQEIDYEVLPRDPDHPAKL